LEQTKAFPIPKEHIINTLYDIIELQNGALILSDVARGLIYYKVTMYGYEWELMYTIKGENCMHDPGGRGERSKVTLQIVGERKDKAREIRREFALLESMLDLHK